MRYLTLEERLRIEAMLKEGKTYKFIGCALNRAPSSISYEVTVNGEKKDYDGNKSHERALKTLLNKNIKIVSNKITFHERYVINRLLKEGKSCGEIAKLIGRGKNTIVIEVRRSGGKENYNPDQAQNDSEIRHKISQESKSITLKERAKTENYFNPYAHLKDRIDNLEMQIEILTETIRKLTRED